MRCVALVSYNDEALGKPDTRVNTKTYHNAREMGVQHSTILVVASVNL